MLVPFNEAKDFSKQAFVVPRVPRPFAVSVTCPRALRSWATRHGGANIVRFGTLCVTHVYRVCSSETVCRLARHLPCDVDLAATRQVGSTDRSRVTDLFFADCRIEERTNDSYKASSCVP